MLEMVISGGQTGVDFAALRAARAAGILTGGWAARGWATEGGPAPWLEGWGLKEAARPGYPARTALNVRQSDATLLFDAGGPGSALTVRECQRLGKPLCRVAVCSYGGTAFLPASAEAPRVAVCSYGGTAFLPASAETPRTVAEWVRVTGTRVLNVAGARESKAPGVGALAEAFLSRVFAILREGVPPC